MRFMACRRISSNTSYSVLFTLRRQLRIFTASDDKFVFRNTPKAAVPEVTESDAIFSSPVEEVTASNQHEQLANSLTPLWRVPYEDQLREKQAWTKRVVEMIQIKLKNQCKDRKIWKNSMPDVLPVRPSPVLEAYRNKDELNVRKGIDGNDKTVGFFVGSPSSDTCIVVSGKHIVNMKPTHHAVGEWFQEYIRSSDLPAFRDFGPDGGNWKGILIRSNEAGHVLAVAVIHPQLLSEEQLNEEKRRLKEFFTVGPGAKCNLHSIYFQACKHTRCTHEQAPFQLIHGEPFIEENLMGYRFRISPDSFFQVNTRAAEVLYETVIEQAKLSSMTTLIDVCCGIGIISILAAKKCRCCVGIDVTASAIQDAKVNAKLNDITNVDFFSGRVEKKLRRALRSLDLASEITAVVNPGRAGVQPRTIEALNDCPQLRRVIYVACKADHPAPIHNFMQLCCLGGFRLKRVVPVDLFPHTLHTELVMVFTR